MNKELEIWRFAAERLKHKETVVLLIVAESSGSSPGRQGFKMIVAHDEMRGSIGGGVMEMRLAKLAELKLNIQSKKFKNDFQIVEQIHRKNAENSSGMICSGKQTIVLYELNCEKNLETINEIIRALENNLLRNLRITAREFELTQNFSRNFQFERQGENDFVYLEKLGKKNKLFIVGGGHCALALSELMSKMDFHISLFDDRADLNTLAKNDFVDEKKIIDSYENIGEFIESGENVYVVVMTLGYKFDEIVIKKLIDKNFKYFGVLGSKAKMKTLWRELENEGFERDRLSKISTPIGLKINSRTPEEIAVSIAAEIIAVKNSQH